MNSKLVFTKKNGSTLSWRRVVLLNTTVQSAGVPLKMVFKIAPICSPFNLSEVFQWYF